MICPRCLQRASLRTVPRQLHHAHSAPFSRSARNSSTSERTPISANVAQTSNPQRSPPAATSTAAAQPFSTPTTLSAKTSGTPTGPSSQTHSDSATDGRPPAPKSSVPAGVPLKGLNYFKGKEDPVALEDHEYPSWLWDALTPRPKVAGDGDDEVDPRLFAKSARSRRMANKRARQHAREHPEEAQRRIPLYEQGVDLPTDDGGVARAELTKGMREKRRKDIKEANFLQGMR